MRRTKSHEQQEEEKSRALRLDYFRRKESAFKGPLPPFRVDRVDRFQKHCQDGYDENGRFQNLIMAVETAERIIEEGIKRCGSFKSWDGRGDAGIVYDAHGELIWDGVIEAKIKYDSARISSAVLFAVRAHGGQFRKGTTIPYVFHPLGVGKILADHGCSTEVIISGILHDTLEDTDFTMEEISRQFGKDVASIVRWCSNLDGSGPWQERKGRVIEAIKRAPFRAVLVAAADKLDNIRAIHRDYELIGEDLWARFNEPRDAVSWYYSELASAFRVYINGSAFNEIFHDFVTEVSFVFER
jgi:hypothetical protein